MGSICRIDINKTNTLLCPVKLEHNNAEFSVNSALLDTGATICHMTYPLWLRMGLHEACWNSNPQLCKLMGINSPSEMVFERLPLISTVSILGDGSQVKVYEFRLDAVELGRPKIGFNHSILFENITVRLINRRDSDFIVGWNILKYLKPDYDPSVASSVYQLALTQNGEQLLQQDRHDKINNHMQTMFQFREA